MLALFPKIKMQLFWNSFQKWFRPQMFPAAFSQGGGGLGGGRSPPFQDSIFVLKMLISNSHCYV